MVSITDFELVGKSGIFRSEQGDSLLPNLWRDFAV